MESWYKVAQKGEKLPWKVLVYDNRSSRGVHTPDMLSGRFINANTEAQAWAILRKTWPLRLLNLVDEYRDRGITVRLVIDEKEADRRKRVHEEKERAVAEMWWQK